MTNCVTFPTNVVGNQQHAETNKSSMQTAAAKQYVALTVYYYYYYTRLTALFPGLPKYPGEPVPASKH